MKYEVPTNIQGGKKTNPMKMARVNYQGMRTALVQMYTFPK